jgi:hypothetical protein
MKSPKIIGRLLLTCFLIFLGLLSWAWYGLISDSGPSDWIGVLLLGIIFFTAYYFALTVWTWRLLKKYSTFNNDVTTQYLIIFIVGVFAPILGIVLLMIYR